MEEAVLNRYKPESMMTEEEKVRERKKVQEDLYVNTNAKGMKKIEMVGFDKAYENAAMLEQSRDITLSQLKISSVGANNALRNMIPGTMNLYLDENLLNDWDQYFKIIKQLDYLRIITLTGNKFNRIDKDYLESRDVNQLIHPHLYEVVLIDMGLDWS